MSPAFAVAAAASRQDGELIESRLCELALAPPTGVRRARAMASRLLACMASRLLACLLAAAVLIFGPWSADIHAAILPAPIQLSANTWAWIGPYEGPSKGNQGFRMNLGFVVGRDAVAVIDTGYTVDMALEMVAAIRRVTSLPIRFAINSNSQPHRFMGNQVFRKQGARVIAGAEAAARMSRDGGDFVQGIANALELKDPPTLPAPPDRLIAEQGSEHLDLGGGVIIQVIHVGRTHTGGSLVARVLPDRTVFAGDVLYAGRLPAILADSSLIGWIAGFERLRGIDTAVFVPGHGQPAALAAFEQPTLAYLKALKNHMDAAFKAGAEAGAAVRMFDASAWKHLVNFSELSGRNAALAYLESEREGF